MKKFVLCGVALLLSGCITSQTMPLAPNVVRIDTQAGGLLFTGQTVPATMKAAATATLNAGYSHFRLSEASTGVGDRYAGTSCGGGANFATCTSIRAPTSQAGVTVTMFHANVAGRQGRIRGAAGARAIPMTRTAQDPGNRQSPRPAPG